MSRRRLSSAIIVVALAWLGLAPPGQAKTILITDEESDQMAAISGDAPRLSWAGMESVPGVWNIFYLELYPNRALLIRFPLDKIPKRQRVTKAEVIVPVDYVYPANEPRLYVRRLLAEWGPGVCHLYRMTSPKPVEWKVPGAKGSGSDRIAKPQVLKPVTGETIINVTEDVELWYSGVVRNHGWMLSNEDSGLIRMGSWAFGGRGRWKLRITYEPE
ncbi:MAG: hypothetical protein FJ271_23150 [Planctomycetes bacterium]|nr:hypothetical protein [Planctomycetota bacterium]